MSLDEFHPAARIEFQDTIDRYADVEERLAADFLDRVEQVVDVCRRHPGWHARIDETDARTALVDRFPYHLIFTSGEIGFRVIAVVHHSRRPGYWIDRLED